MICVSTMDLLHEILDSMLRVNMKEGSIHVINVDMLQLTQIILNCILRINMKEGESREEKREK